MNFKNSLAHLKQGLNYFFKQKYLIYLASLTLLAGSAISIVLSLSSEYYSRIFTEIPYIKDIYIHDKKSNLDSNNVMMKV